MIDNPQVTKESQDIGEYYLKIIRPSDPWLKDPKNYTGMSWSSIKRIRKATPDNRTFTSYNGYRDITIGSKVIVYVSKLFNLYSGVINEIIWEHTHGLEFKTLKGRQWEHFFQVSDSSLLAKMPYRESLTDVYVSNTLPPNFLATILANQFRPLLFPSPAC